MATHKALAQRRLRLRDRHARLKVRAIRVKNHAVGKHLGIEDFLRKKARRPIAAGQEHRAPGFGQMGARPVQHGKELFPRNRLEQIMERAHIVSFRHAIRVPGDKNDLRPAPLRAQFARKFHAAHAAHPNVQQQKIEFLPSGAVKDKRLRRGKRLEGNVRARAPRPIARQGEQQFPLRWNVFANGNG